MTRMRIGVRANEPFHWDDAHEWIEGQITEYYPPRSRADAGSSAEDADDSNYFVWFDEEADDGARLRLTREWSHHWLLTGSTIQASQLDPFGILS